MTKTYRCPRLPGLNIGSRVVFEDGVFTTSDPNLQRLVEINRFFGTAIFLDGVDHPPGRQRQAGRG